MVFASMETKIRVRDPYMPVLGTVREVTYALHAHIRAICCSIDPSQMKPAHHSVEFCT